MKQSSLLIAFLLFVITSHSQSLNVRLLDNVKANNLDSIKWLVEQGADVNYQDENLASVLMWSAYRADLAMCELLVNKGANYKIKGTIYTDSAGSYYGHLMGIAVGEGKTDLLEYFLETLQIYVDDKELNPASGKEDGWTALHWAGRQGNLDACIMLVTRGGNLNSRHAEDGMTPLLYSLKHGHFQTASYILNHGSDLTQKNNMGWKALHFLAQNKHISLLLQVLKEEKQIDDQINHYGYTPLMISAYYGNLITCSLLVNAGASIVAKDSFGLSTLDIAETRGNKRIVQFLKSTDDSFTIYHLLRCDEFSDLFVKYFSLERYSELLEMQEPYKRICEKNDSDNSIALANLAMLYQKTGRSNMAETTYMEALEIASKTFGKGHPNHLTILGNLATFQTSVGDYRKAIISFYRALHQTETIYGRETDQYSSIHREIANTHRLSKNLDSALFICFSGISHVEATLGKNSSEYNYHLNLLGRIYEQKGDHEKALSYKQKALENARRCFGDQSLQFFNSLQYLTDYFIFQGDYSAALSLIIDALQGIDKNNPICYHLLQSLAILYQDLGDYEQAQKYLFDVLENTRLNYGVKHSNFGASLNNTAGLIYRVGNYEYALQLYRLALKNVEENHGTVHFEYGLILCNIGGILELLGRHPDALEAYLEAENTLKNNLGVEDVNYGICLNNLAKLYDTMGELPKADSCYRTAINVIKNHNGIKSILYSKVLWNYGVSQTMQGSLEIALPILLEVCRINRTLINQDFMSLTSSERFYSLSSASGCFPGTESIAHRYNIKTFEMASEIFSNLLFSKNISLNHSRKVMNEIRLNGTVDDFAIYKSWSALMAQLAAEYSKPISQRTNIDSLVIIANSLERRLIQRSSIFAKEQLLKAVNWQQVRSQLEPKEVAIEFSHFDCFNQGWTGNTLYAAYLLRADSEYPEMVYLFEEKELDTIVQQGSLSSLYPSRGFTAIPGKKNGKGLYEVVWSSLESHLDGIEKIYYAPSGKLHQVAFAAMADSMGQLVSDKFQLVQLSSTGKLVVSEPEPETSPALFMGGIQYRFDSTGQSKCDSCVQVYNPIAINRSTDDRKSLTYLAGTEAEANALFQLYKSNTLPVSRVTQSAATEDYVKSLSGNGPKVLHLATHGFFFEDPEDKRDDFLQLQGPTSFTLADDPLMRSGLLMAGAAYAWEYGQNPYSKEDGVLTAYEISHLDLSNTDLVVLSACETGLGDIEGSEGVYGLQRAFRMAGVEYIIMSLWAVPDKETSEFMQLFYKTWLGGEGIYAAFTHAQREMATKYRDDPQLWAGFVLVQ